VPTDRGGHHLRRCLASLRESRRRPAEIIIVLNGVRLQGLRPGELAGTRIVHLHERRSPGSARNEGARLAREPILLFVDDDVTVHPETLERVVSAMEGAPELGGLFGSCDDQPGATNFLSQYRSLLQHYIHQNGSPEASTFWAACGAVRASLFRQLGGFDTAMVGLEGVELGQRIRRAGHEIRLERTVLVKQHKRWDLGSLLRPDPHRARPSVLRDCMPLSDLSLRWTSRISAALLVTGLGGVAASPWHPPLALLLPASLVTVTLINRSLHLFLARQRGLTFAARAVPCHWLFLIRGSATVASFRARSLCQRRDPDA
jgi:hypothetical protein